MNYFEFYDLPITFNVAASQLKKAFLLKSKATHPDYFTLASTEEQAKAMEEAVINNQAYKILSDKNLRTKYILELFEVYQGEKQKLPMDFLMEMMDLNEQVEAAKNNPEVKVILKNTLAKKIENLDKSENPLMTKFDEQQDVEILKDIYTIYLERKYLERIGTELES